MWDLRSIFALVTALLRRNDGVAALEFALITPVLVGLLVPLTDLGMGFYQQMQVRDAAAAGSQYASRHGWNSAAIQNAVTSATSLGSISASPAPAQSCGCPNGASISASSCSATCPDGQLAGTYVTVNAQSAYTPLIPYPVLGSTLTLTAQSIVRIQ